MLHTLSGRLVKKEGNCAFIENNGFGFKILVNERTMDVLPAIGAEVKFFCYLYLRETQFELYGFPREDILKLFEMLNTVAGVGPKTALGILDAGPIENLMAAILEKRFEFLTRAAGIGRKTAERIVLELQNKIKLPNAKAASQSITVDEEVEEALVALGYSRQQTMQALRKLSAVPTQGQGFTERFKQALNAINH